MQKQPKSTSVQTLKRLPTYLSCLKEYRASGQQNISAGALAGIVGLNEVQVRKDIASVSTSGGKPRTGFVLDELISDIEGFLGYNSVTEAVLVGVGHLGRALLSYQGFQNYGLKIVAAFDSDPQVCGLSVNDVKVLPVAKLQGLCRRMNTRIGIIAVPGGSAQEVCDLMVGSGILAIWNFAPVSLSVPEGIFVHREDMAASLALISKHLSQNLHQ
ncbi:MAG: redox-sensing transcriptional repressor Rex [Bacillota bacterium]|nr:redox-sensing transcriptional repressor Rex [Bacillota bacterium]